MSNKETMKKAIDGMRLCLVKWRDSRYGVRLASIYLNLYNKHYVPKLFEVVMDIEAYPYALAAFQARQAGSEPQNWSKESYQLMMEIIEVYGEQVGGIEK